MQHHLQARRCVVAVSPAAAPAPAAAAGAAAELSAGPCVRSASALVAVGADCCEDICGCAFAAV